MDRDIRLKRLRFRAWHRGTREAEYMIGGYFDRHAASWDEGRIALFEEFLEEQDVDIMAWAFGVQPVPERWAGTMMEELKRLDYIAVGK